MRALLACRRESWAGPQGWPSADRKRQCSEGGRESWAGPELTGREREEELGWPSADWKGECAQLAAAKMTGFTVMPGVTYKFYTFHPFSSDQMIRN